MGTARWNRSAICRRNGCGRQSHGDLGLFTGAEVSAVEKLRKRPREAAPHPTKTHKFVSFVKGLVYNETNSSSRHRINLADYWETGRDVSELGILAVCCCLPDAKQKN